MKPTRRQVLLVVWILSIVVAGALVGRPSGAAEYGLAVACSLLAVSLGVPLMRAFTEFSK